MWFFTATGIVLWVCVLAIFVIGIVSTLNDNKKRDEQIADETRDLYSSPPAHPNCRSSISLEEHRLKKAVELIERRRKERQAKQAKEAELADPPMTVYAESEEDAATLLAKIMGMPPAEPEGDVEV